MDFRHKRLRQPPFRHCVTVRCDLACAFCESCRSGAEPPGGWDRAPSGSPGSDPRVIQLHGGDALRFGDLAAWVGWARGNPKAWVDVEGPAYALAGADAQAAIERLVAARPDGMTVALPTLDPARTAPLTGRSWEPALALDGLAAIAERGLATTVVVPVNADTVDGVREVLLGCAERLGERVDLVLRRSPPSRGGPRRLPLVGGGARWEELPSLSLALASLPPSLPATLPGGARLHFDPARGFAPCMVSPAARRPGLFAAREEAGRPNAALAACAVCSWRLRCTFSVAPHDPSGAPPDAQVTPLRDDEALALQEGADPEASHRPHAARTRWDRRERDLPDVLCVSPWTSMAATEFAFHPVPCALSWVDTAVATDEAAESLGIPVAEMQELERRARREYQGFFHCVDNHALSLYDLWNNPLLRVMRREMLRGPRSAHCRSMCRTIMGVDDRGADLLAMPDAELSPAIVENRNLLLDEMRAGRSVLTAKPLELVMGVASHCNITCGFCHGPGGLGGELTDARRDEIIEWLPTMISFAVVGPGEPLMSRNYLALLAHIADVGYPSLRVALTTNGTLLRPAFLERYRGIRWSHVRISLNAGSAKTHERMTGKRLFEQVIENLEALVALRDAREPPFDVTLSCVLSEMVMGDLHRFAELVTAYRTRVIVEPMYGDLEGLSPWVRPDKLAVLADELGAVATDFALRNPPLAKAFRAVEGFARDRLASGDVAVLAHH